MKKMLTVSNGAYIAARMSVVLVVTLGLGFGFWTVMTPVAKAQQRSATEMIEASLPSGKTMVTASKSQYLAAVCAAVKKSPGAAAQIVKAAVDTRRQLSRDIVTAATRCLPNQGDCAQIGAIVDAAVDADPDSASEITDMALRLYPDCRGAISGGRGTDHHGDGEGNFVNPPPNVNPPPGSIGGGASEVARCTICHVPPGNPSNPQTLTLPCNAAEAHLRNHSLDYAGPCVVTGTQNR